MPDHDFAYVHSLSQAPSLGESCHQLHTSLTKMFDAIWNSDEVDAFDASCNTCKHFQRKPMTPEEKAERNTFGMPGHCSLKGVSTVGWQRGQFDAYSNSECYENRRTGMRHGDACKGPTKTTTSQERG